VILGYAAVLLTLSGAPADTVAVARRIAASADLAAQEYRLGVVGGRVVLPAEVEEAHLFLGEARRTAASLPGGVSARAIAEIDRALHFVEAVGSPDSVSAAARRLSVLLTTELGVTLVEIPVRTPSLVRGAELYRRECASCHGIRGEGDGPAGRGLEPAPANLADHAALADVTPLAFYQRITIGVAGTAMPAYETRLDAADRWALALYATTLRQARAAGEVPPALQAFAATAERNDAELLEALGPGATRELLAAVRAWQDTTSAGTANAATFATVRAKIAEATGHARAGRADAAMASAFDAYIAFEGVERTVHARNAGLAADLEASFATLRARVASPDSVALAGIARELDLGLARAEAVVEGRMGATSIFVQSLMILVREGLEAILIIGALLAFLTKVGAGEKRRHIHAGVGAAVGLSILTAIAFETVFRISTANQEVVEGITMLVAVAVLFYVSYWLLSKLEVERWMTYVREKTRHAVTGGSAVALGSAAFLAVYREGFETVLFYKALFISGGSATDATGPVVAGMAVGGVVLAAVYLAVHRYGVRLPLKPFFAVTSAFLYYTAFVFAGKGIAELQAGGVVGSTPMPGWPLVPVLGIFPTLETLMVQAVLLLLAMVAGVVLWMRRRGEVRVGAGVRGDPLPGAVRRDA
jgi:high-affinity iron transporter